MARALRPTLVDLLLEPEAFEVYDGDAVGDLPRAPSRTSLAWDVTGPHVRGEEGWGWGYRAPGEGFRARARLPRAAGVYPVDATVRTCRTPTIAPAAVRAWQAIELFFDEPENAAGAASGATVRFRLHDGTDELWWNGAEWALAGAGEWNTAEDIQGHVAALSARERALGVVARLATTDEDYTPSFFGARVLYGCREVGDQDDALIRTVLASIQAEVVDVTGVVEVLAAAGAVPIELGGEMLYDVVAMQAVFNLTEDPLEEGPLAGTFVAGDVNANPPTPATWTPTVALTAGDVIRLEYGFRPHVVVTQHRDIEELDRLPAIYLAPMTTPVVTATGQGEVLVRNLYADPPVAVAAPAAELLEHRIEIRIIAELGNDVNRIARALRAWLGGHGGRRLVSPETARIVEVREIEPLQTTTAMLTQGVQEARGTWLLTYLSAGFDTTTDRTLVAEDGVAVTIEE